MSDDVQAIIDRCTSALDSDTAAWRIEHALSLIAEHAHARDAEHLQWLLREVAFVLAGRCANDFQEALARRPVRP